MAVPTVTVVIRAGGTQTLQHPSYTLNVISGPDKKKEVRIRQRVARIGSGEGAELKLSDPTVSALHAQLSVDAAGFRLRDLGAKNGVLVDGRRVSELWLRPRDEFTLGKSVIRFKRLDELEESPLAASARFGRLRGHSIRMRELFSQLERAAPSDAPVLLLGETGTGKELVAEALVTEGARKDHPLVVLDCGRLHTTLAESELFGHEKGAFTGALRQVRGAFERAHGGTLFLDEIGELPLELQPKLLSALERRWVQRVGGTEPLPVDVRVVSATHRDLEQEVNRGTFRADLFYRISALTLRLPPLRERPEDIPELVAHFLQELGASVPGPVLERLYRGDYPGNVRQLRAAVERAALGLEEPQVMAETVSQLKVSLGKPYRLQKDRFLEVLDREYFGKLLEACGGNMSEAARRSGVNRVHLYAIVQRLKEGERQE